jgi:hypothetical protein
VSGRFRKFSSPGDQGIEDLVVEEGGEVIYVKASGSGGFGNWSWLHRPSASGNVKVTDLNVVDVNGDGVDDLSLTLSDDTLALFIGGTSNGLSSAVKQTSPLIVGDITLDACVDLKDWQILNDNYGYPVSAGSAARADLNGDGWVDYFDYLKLVQHWGEGSGCP